MKVRRRTVIKLGIVGTVAAGLAATGSVAQGAPTPSPGPQSTPGAPASRKNDPKDSRGRRVPLARYAFTPTLLDGTSLPDVFSLEAVWAQTRYLETVSYKVKFNGPTPDSLTDRENAAVDAAIASGAKGARTKICLDIVAACTRIDQRTVYAGLTAVGRPIVDGALVMAPTAPQAAVMTRWIAEGMPSTGAPAT